VLHVILILLFPSDSSFLNFKLNLTTIPLSSSSFLPLHLNTFLPQHSLILNTFAMSAPVNIDDPSHLSKFLDIIRGTNSTAAAAAPVDDQAQAQVDPQSASTGSSVSK
jgi:hypothetical protein